MTNILLLQSRVLTNTDSRITDGCSPQVAVDHKGANLTSVTESSISSKGVYVSGCWSSPAAGTVFRFPEERSLDGVYTRMLRMVLNVSWEDHVKNVDLYGALPRVTDKIRARRMGLTGHCVHDKYNLLINVNCK